MAQPPLPHISMTGLNAFLEVSPDALVVINQTGIIVALNTQACQLFGYAPDDLLKQPLEVLLPERLRMLHLRHRDRYLQEPHLRPMGVGLDLLGRRRDGSEFPVDVSLRPVMVGKKLHILSAIRDMTAQYRIHQERSRLAEITRVQAELINLARDAIVVRDLASRVLSWNRGAEELYGWTQQEALGRVTHQLLQTHFLESLTHIQARLELDGFWKGELVHRRRDGQIIFVESRWALLRGEHGEPQMILEINRDITERRLLQQAQQVSQSVLLSQLHFLQQVVDILPNSVSLVHGHQARLLLGNRAGVVLWGHRWPVEQPMQEFLAVHGIEILDPLGQPLPQQNWATFRALGQETVIQQQEIIQRADGTRLVVLVNSVPLQAQQHRHQFAAGQEEDDAIALVVHIDVTFLKETEYLKDEFLSIVVHELHTPLAVLKGAITTLQVQTARGHGPVLAAWQYETLQDIEAATERLIALTEDLFDATKLQIGHLTLRPQSLNIVEFVKNIVARMQQTTSKHRLELHVPGPTLRVVIDPSRFEQILTNLLSNAIKYSPEGGQVVVTLWQDAESWGLRIQDRGIGIPAHQQAVIFGRFMRADNARESGIAGTGLGLYLCRALTELQHGRLWFQSTEGEGSTFFLSFPLQSFSPEPLLLDS
ncbi:MAG TPA: PAS domain S-box protein [Ktedonobacteraceae bacterium]|nr:PAS domain S-box protein [Ktedonobacteraceae bacterium]